ncbi:MAG: Ribonuclease [Myxococcales bacterium]|nr:Ribonuclease [Myxococcales bacterium]
MPVADEAEVAAIAAALSRAPLATFDLEFLAQDRLVPTLCLVQVSWLPHDSRLDVPATVIVATPPTVAILDPLAVDVGPVIRALAAHPCVVAHAPRQDLALLATRFGVAMPAVVDTQLMAAFAGIGDQVGLASLANELLGLALGKEQQWTDWGQRPLSDAQLAYADSDVRHLPAIWALMRDRLGERMAWALAESTLVAADAVAATQVTPETAWSHLGSLRGLDVQGLAAAISLAAWRHRTAVEMDRPLGQVLHEKVLLELARTRPPHANAVRNTKGMSPIAKQRADELVAALTAARPADVPVLSLSRSPSARAQRWAEFLIAIVQLVSDRTRVAPRLLVTRSEAEEFARTVDERGLEAAAALPALATWRREVLGALWVGWLSGTVAFVGDLAAPSGFALR